MSAYLTTQNLILAGVFAHLLLAVSRSVFKRPAQQAQIDAIESKVDSTVSTVQQILPVVSSINRKTFTTAAGAASALDGITMALNPLPSDPPAGSSNSAASTAQATDTQALKSDGGTS